MSRPSSRHPPVALALLPLALGALSLLGACTDTPSRPRHTRNSGGELNVPAGLVATVP